jgi:lipopolysaccharide transport system permease protein
MTAFVRRPLHLIFKYRKILAAVTRVELAKRYSGSILGAFWVLLYPCLLLSMYLFVYSVVFRMQFAGSSRMDYVIYVFCGLIPFIGFMEGVTSGCVAIKQNIHLIKNVMLPIELIPLRYVTMSMVSELIGLGLLVGLIVVNGSAGLNLLGLPLVILLQFMLLTGIVWFIAPLAVVFPDTSYFVNLFVLLLMFVSPIGYQPDMVQGFFRFALYLNPVYYMTEVFRGTAIAGHGLSFQLLAIYIVISVMTFFAGSLFFVRFKKVVVDYE